MTCLAVATCTITADDVRSAWRRLTNNPHAELPEDALDYVMSRATMVEAAMEDAAMGIVGVLLVDLADF